MISKANSSLLQYHVPLLLQLLSVAINEVPHSKSMNVTNFTASFPPCVLLFVLNPIIAMSPGEMVV